MSVEAILFPLSQARQFVREKKPGLIAADPLGLLSGVVYREVVVAQMMADCQWPKERGEGSRWKEMLLNAQRLPLPFWIGIHPKVAVEMCDHLDRDDEGYWDQRMGKEVRPVRSPRITAVEKVDMQIMKPQVERITAMLPEGSLNTIFITEGRKSIWNKVPVAGAFSGNPHQMSLPYNMALREKGFNMLLLTTTPSETTPAFWNTPFPGEKLSDTDNKLAWMNMHQVGHCLVVPTCWEYVDRTYSLMTPREMLTLADMRMKALNQWFLDYYGLGRTPFVPDSTSYLYEVKIAERAAAVATHTHLPEQELPADLLWFAGLHLEELSAQLKIKPGVIAAGVTAMDDYLMENHHNIPTNPIFNSAVHSTDIGTHPVEEIVVDVLAMARLGKLPPHYDYWKPFVNEVFGMWRRWDPGFTARV